MSHAEICPICQGKGKVKPGIYEEEKSCHGCGGSGWVVVPDQGVSWIPMVEEKK